MSGRVLTGRGLDHDLPAQRLRIMGGTTELSLQSRRADFELIRVLEGRFVVEKAGQATGELGETVDVHVVTVDDHPEHPTTAATRQLEVIELEPLGGEIGLYHAPNVCYLRQI